MNTLDKQLSVFETTAKRIGTPIPKAEAEESLDCQNVKSAKGRRIELIRADTITPQRTDWVWEGRIPQGAMSIICGDPDVGKTLVALDLAARWTRGQCEGSLRGIPVNVLIASAEDSPAHTLNPRLRAAGADLTRVHFIKLLLGEEEVGGLSLPEDIPLLEEKVQKVQAKILIIDPLMSHIDGKLNANKDQDVRKALGPLALLSEDLSVVIVCHLNKNESQGVKYRIGGNMAIFAVPRSVLLAGEHPEHEGENILLHLKCNVGEKAVSLWYAMERKQFANDEGITIETGGIVWKGEAAGITAEGVLGHKKDPEKQSDLKEAMVWLQSYLDGGLPLSVIETIKSAEKNGIKEWTLKRARTALGVETRRRGFGKDAFYAWVLPRKQGSSIEHNVPDICNPCITPQKLNNIPNDLSMDDRKGKACHPYAPICLPCEMEEEVVVDDY